MEEHRFTVGEAQRGQRLDRFLASTGVVSRTRARKLLSDGAVYLNRRRVKIASRRVNAGDRITCYVSHNPPAAPVQALPLLYRDSDLVVVNKPPGMPVQATRESDRGTVVSVLRTLLHDVSLRPRVVHRLDQPASGALVVALTTKAAAYLSDLMARHATRRRYLVVVEGRWAEDRTLVHYLRPPPRSRRRQDGGRVEARPFEGAPRMGEREAVTRIHVMATNEQYSLLKAELETGRTHQVRAQLAFEGFPVLSDVRYGASRPVPDVSGIALHAWVLEFPHPRTSAPVRVEAPLPGRLQAWLEAQGLVVPELPRSPEPSTTSRES